MKKAYDMNKGLDRLIESYKKPVKRGYTEALSKKAKSKTNLLKENYSVVDLETGERFGKFDSVESAKSKAQRYSQQCSATCAVVSNEVSDDSDFKVICGYKNGKERKVTNEALSNKVKTNLLKEGFYHFEYTSGANPYVAFSKKERDRILRKYKGKVEDLGDNHYLINDDEYTPNYFTWDTDDESFNEALSDEAKANNEMIQKILNKKPSQLTAKEKQFLADNDLVRQGGPGNAPSIGKSGAPYYNSIGKGDKSIINHGLGKSNKSTFADINSVDQLNYLKKRQDRWKAHNDRTNNDILEPDGRFGWGSKLQDFNKFYAHDIEASKKSAQDAKDYIDSYIERGGDWKVDFAKHSADDSRKLKDRAKKSLEYRPRFSESLEDDDYYDFVNDLATTIQKTSKKWKNRGVSSSDVVDALNELALKFEEASEYDEPDNEE